MDNQSQKMNSNELYARGYTIRQAAKVLKVSPTHISCVLRGERQSKSLMARLVALPQRRLTLREILHS